MAEVEKNSEEGMQLQDGDIVPTMTTAIAGIVIIALLFFLQRRRSGRRDLLLMGLCESGKTAIFMQIVFKRLPGTYASFQENVGHFVSGRWVGRLVDIPGQYRVHKKYFDTYKKTAKGIIFVVDSETIETDIRDVAEAFYNIVSDSATNFCSILVLCNKQDLDTAESAEVVRSILENEINNVRDTRSRTLSSSTDDDAPTKSVYVGKEGKDFEFSHLKQRVQFCEGSAMDNQLQQLWQWIYNLQSTI